MISIFLNFLDSYNEIVKMILGYSRLDRNYNFNLHGIPKFEIVNSSLLCMRFYAFSCNFYFLTPFIPGEVGGHISLFAPPRVGGPGYYLWKKLPHSLITVTLF